MATLLATTGDTFQPVYPSSVPKKPGYRKDCTSVFNASKAWLKSGASHCESLRLLQRGEGGVRGAHT